MFYLERTKKRTVNKNVNSPWLDSKYHCTATADDSLKQHRKEHQLDLGWLSLQWPEAGFQFSGQIWKSAHCSDRAES